ncbi:MAG: HAMP domain-containing protein, partial [Oceanisphaera sp.]
MLSKIGHLSVRAKLTLGFALVLLATLITATVSFYSLSSVLERSDKLEKAGEIDLLVSKARFFQKNYMLINDLDQLEQARTHVDEARVEAESLQSLMTVPKDKALVKDILAGTQFYETELDNMVELNERFHSELAELNQLGALAQQRAERLSARESVAMNWLLKLVHIRLTQKDFALNREAATATQLAADLKSLLSQLENRLLMQESDDVQTMLEQLKRFQEQQQSLVSITQNLATTDKRITEHAINIANKSEELLTIQQQDMQRDSSQAEIVIALVTLIGLALGILFAIMITRGIVNPLSLLVTQANRIAEGDLSQDITHNRKDELGKLMDQMQL